MLQTRLWRKTRSYHNSALGCRGVDANRNYGFHWHGIDKFSLFFRFLTLPFLSYRLRGYVNTFNNIFKNNYECLNSNGDNVQLIQGLRCMIDDYALKFQRVVHRMTSVGTLTMDLRLSRSQRFKLFVILCLLSRWGNQETFSYTILCREGRVKYFNNMHSFSQLVLLSYGHTTTPPENYMDFVKTCSVSYFYFYSSCSSLLLTKVQRLCAQLMGQNTP